MKSFYYLVKDRDGRTFSIEGPMNDDRPWDKAVCDAQDVGRQSSSEALSGPVEAAVAELVAQAYRQVPSRSIVSP